MPTGRPTKYTKVMAEEICSRIASGESLRSICKDDHIAAMANVMKWLLSDAEVYKGFREQYAQARQIQYELMADEIMDIADDGSNDYMKRTGKDGDEGYVLNGEHVQRSRLRVDSRKWFLSKVLPRFADSKDNNADATAANLAATLASLVDKLPGA